MVNQQYSPLQLYTAPRNLTGLVEENKLWEAYRMEPDKLPAVMAQAFGMKHGQAGLIEMLTQGRGRVTEKKIKNRRYEWELFTEDNRSIEVVGLLNSSTTPGLGGEIFYLIFSEKWFELGANLRADNGQIVRVMEDPYQQGNEYVYAVQLNDSNPAAILESINYQAGARFMEVWADYEEGSVRGTGVHVSTPAKLANQIGTFRKTVSITRHGHYAKQFMPIMSKDENGKPKQSYVWAEEVVWLAMKDIQKSLAYAGMYSNTKKGHQVGSTGRPVTMGAGIRQQMAPSNKREFVGAPTYDDFNDFAESLYQAAIDAGNDMEVVVLTGQDGMRIVEEVIAKQLAVRFPNITLNSEHFVKKDGKDLSLGGFFRILELPCGITLKFKNFALYNDRDFHRLYNPKTGNPWESSRFTFLNFGLNSNGEPNIQKVIPEGGQGVVWTVGGSTDASGARKSKSSQGASGFDGYEVHLLEECGYVITDPTLCGELIPAGLKDF